MSGYETRKEYPSSQGSFQNRTTSPSYKITFLPSKYKFFTFIIAFQQEESLALLLSNATVLFLRYLALVILYHRPGCVSNFHHHLQRRLKFCLCKSFTPRPPFLLERQILPPFNHIIFPFVAFTIPKKNFLQCLSSFMDI